MSTLTHLETSSGFRFFSMALSFFFLLAGKFDVWKSCGFPKGVVWVKKGVVRPRVAFALELKSGENCKGRKKVLRAGVEKPWI